LETNPQATQTPIYQRIWFSPVVALATFALGLIAGFYGRPLLSPETGEASLPSPVSGDPGQGGNQEVMDFLIEETRHFKGDPSAPVTIIEFSDFK
jgi:hypothetical protein